MNGAEKSGECVGWIVSGCAFGGPFQWVVIDVGDKAENRGRARDCDSPAGCSESNLSRSWPPKNTPSLGQRAIKCCRYYFAVAAVLFFFYPCCFGPSFVCVCMPIAKFDGVQHQLSAQQQQKHRKLHICLSDPVHGSNDAGSLVLLLLHLSYAHRLKIVDNRKRIARNAATNTRFPNCLLGGSGVPHPTPGKGAWPHEVCSA